MLIRIVGARAYYLTQLKNRSRKPLNSNSSDPRPGQATARRGGKSVSFTALESLAVGFDTIPSALVRNAASA
jgi:hypothetical protein